MKKFVSILLAVLVVMSCFAVAAFAEEAAAPVDEAFTVSPYFELILNTIVEFVKTLVHTIMSYIPMPLV